MSLRRARCGLGTGSRLLLELQLLGSGLLGWRAGPCPSFPEAEPQVRLNEELGSVFWLSDYVAVAVAVAVARAGGGPPRPFLVLTSERLDLTSGKADTLLGCPFPCDDRVRDDSTHQLPVKVSLGTTNTRGSHVIKSLDFGPEGLLTLKEKGVPPLLALHLALMHSEALGLQQGE
ncbi:hypothetical protein P7K49_001957, partial [Saguinus oedipus]